MARFKETNKRQGQFIPVIFEEQILPGTIEHAICDIINNHNNGLPAVLTSFASLKPSVVKINDIVYCQVLVFIASFKNKEQKRRAKNIIFGEIMAKEWILNSAMNRFQLNFKRNVGAVAEEIRKCSPKTLEDWEKYYFVNVRTQEHITELGKKLYVKITEVISSEVEQITEDDCINYMFTLVINRTFDGYTTEIKTIYGQLEEILKINIEPAPDKWDRLYNVDFFIKIEEKYIGLQIKLVRDVSHIPQIYKEKGIQEKTHKKFSLEYGGKVFYIFSIKDGNKKKIHNIEIIKEIQEEISRLKKE